jgi:hypothetical protein
MKEGSDETTRRKTTSLARARAACREREARKSQCRDRHIEPIPPDRPEVGHPLRGRWNRNDRSRYKGLREELVFRSGRVRSGHMHKSYTRCWLNQVLGNEITVAKDDAGRLVNSAVEHGEEASPYARCRLNQPAARNTSP